MRWGQPRSLQARQLLAASLGLLAFLALAGYALDRAFLDTAENNLRQRLKSYALAFAADGEFARNGEFIPPFQSVDPRLEMPGSGLYAEVVLPDGHWDSPSAVGPNLPSGRMLPARTETFEGPLPITKNNRVPITWLLLVSFSLPIDLKGSNTMNNTDTSITPTKILLNTSSFTREARSAPISPPPREERPR